MKSDLIKLKRQIELRKERSDFFESFNVGKSFKMVGGNNIICVMTHTVEVQIRTKDIKKFKKPLPVGLCKIQTINHGIYVKGGFVHEFETNHISEFLPGHVVVSFGRDDHSSGIDLIYEYFELVED